MSVQPIDIGNVKFKLRFNNTNREYWIDPPIGWDKMRIELKRTGKYARQIKFGQDQEIEFWKHKPISLGHRFDTLIDYHKLFGDESFVELLNYVDDEILMAAELDFEKAVTDRESYFKCKIIVNDLSKKIEDLEDTKVDVFGSESLLGNYNDPAQSELVTLYPKKIREVSRHVIGNEDGEESNVDWILDKTFPNTNGEEVIIGNPWGYLKTQQNDSASSYYVDPGTNYVNNGPGLAIPDTYISGSLNQTQNYYFKVQTDFSLNINNVNIKYDGNGVSNSMCRIVLLMAVITYDNAEHDNVIDKHYEILSDTVGKEVVVNTQWSGPLPKYTRLIFEFRVYVSFRNGRQWSKTTINHESEFFGSTIGIYPGSKAKMTRLINAGKKILSNYTENQALINAPRFLQGGEFWWYYITSGFFIRGFDGSSFDLSFKEWKEFIQNAFNCDVQVNGNHVFVGRHEDFYIDKEIARFEFKPDVDSYEITFNEDLIINNFSIGYDKYEDDEVDTLDAFHTESEWYVPKRNKGSLDVKIPFTADGYSIEYARREGIDAEPTTSKSKDDDVYIVDCFVNRVFIPIINVYLDILQNRQNQGFDWVHNIFSPESAYNLRLSLKRLMIDHYSYRFSEIGQKINSAMVMPSNVIAKNTYFKANGDLLTKSSGLQTTDLQIKDNNDLIQEQLPSPLIGSEIYDFKLAIRMKYDKLISMYKSIINENGYVTLYTSEKEMKFYPFDMSYDWIKEELKFKAEIKHEI